MNFPLKPDWLSDGGYAEAARVAKAHNLAVVDFLFSFSSTAVFRAIWSGRRVVVKVTSFDRSWGSELAALSLYARRGAAPTSHLIEPGVFVMEDVGDQRLGRKEPFRSVSKLVELLGKMRIPVGGFPGRSLTDDLLIRHQRIIADSGYPMKWREDVDGVFRRLSTFEGEYLVHGDLNLTNVADLGEHLVAIDPYGLSGQSEYDVAFVSMEFHDSRSLFLRLVADLSLSSELADLWWRWLVLYRLDNAKRYSSPWQPELAIVAAETLD